ncbi:hypothetical protein [Actinokineospora sp. HUAS TT18]|uniref:hypothetical protein n=1 Tax=Actinokineospora sp. HUAS TT18 TaxID=3447451 RepID=UPI003F51B223
MTGPQQPYGQPQGYGQPYGQPPYGQPPQPPRKSRAWVIALVLVLLLLAGGGGWFWWWSSRDLGSPTLPPVPTETFPTSDQPVTPMTVDPSALPETTTKAPMGEDKVAEARGHAEKYVTAVNAKDEAAAKALTCQKTRAGAVFTVGSETGQAKLAEKPRTVEGDRVVFEVEVSLGRVLPVEVNADDGWCVLS